MRRHALAASLGAIALAGSGHLALAQTTGSITADIIPLQDWQAETAVLDGWSADTLIDADVRDPSGDVIGNVENIIFGMNGEVLSVIAEIGGFWDIGDTHVSIPWSSVEVSPAGTGVVVPVTEDTVDDYTLFQDEVLTAFGAQRQIGEVSGGGFGEVETGPRAFRATEYLGDYVRLSGGDGMVNYGYIEDVVIKDGEIAAVMVRPDVGWGATGTYAYPYYGTRSGWSPASPYYDLPYTRQEIERLEPVDNIG
ncbi:MAG TPA: PRC-barrel domain-containing protein [Devosiaceae bacterium]|jgi:sporulation protein YlmC with PRC-barrel domain|nr:PRC-barrel domain-containing protein [Devosiaceae bacterium]